MGGQTAAATNHITPNRDVARRRWDPPGASASGAIAVSATALGAAALGALAMSVLAIGALAIRRLAVRRVRARSIVIDQLTVNRLVVRSASPSVRESFEPIGQGNVTQAASARRSMNGHGERATVRPRAGMHPGDEAAPGTLGTGEQTCPVCGGAGLVDSQRCANCEGTGKIVQAIGGGC